MRSRRRWHIAIGLCSVAALVLVLLGVTTRLPDPLFDEPRSSVLLDRNGVLLGARIASDGQWRFAARDSVPAKFAAAAIVFEDKRFRRHIGVDPLALARAAWTNFKAREIVSGGSTISMQVIRMARGSRPRTYREKLIEIALAIRLELSLTKDEVLTLYSANAPFGGNVVGLEAAAWRYFGRDPNELSWAEAAMLAVLPNSPGAVHLGSSRAVLLNKRDGLLRRLWQSGVIEKLELDLALLEPLPADPLSLPQSAPHLLQTLAADDGGVGRRYTSTLDWSSQQLVTDIVDRQLRVLESQGIRHLSALVIDNRSFEVVAYVGNGKWSSAEGTGYAIDLIHRPRSTGSILKPLLFARMLDAGEILPETLVPDIPAQFAGYAPENFDREFRGAISAKAALARSLNVPAVWMLRRHGVDRFYDFLRRMGMTTLNRPPGHYGLTLVLGGAEGTLWDVTSMYAYMARTAKVQHTRRLQPSVLLQQPESKSEQVPSQPIANESAAILSVGAAWLTMEALLEVVRPGTDSQWRVLGSRQRVAWKTGTSYGHRDAWAVGVTPRYTVGIWAGNASGEGRPGLTGLGAAAPVLFDILNRLDSEEWFFKPETHLKNVKACLADGFLAAGQCEATYVLAPRSSPFEQPSPHHQLIHIDPASGQRVHGKCESVHNMSSEVWFALPPVQEAYYRRWNHNYRTMPAYRDDCAATESEALAKRSVDFVYPRSGSAIYIPVELGGRRGRAVFMAVHRDPGATLHWHLDDRYVGSTSMFHEQALDMGLGWHTLTVVDERGNNAHRRFEVLSKGAASSVVSEAVMRTP